MKALGWLSLLLFSCAGMSDAEIKYAAITAECKVKVESECVWSRGADGREHPNEDCKALKECDARIDAWESGK